jgi:tetratricopeptide (TPR) repeat protein
MSENLRCLAVRQPYAWAIVAGAKDMENRRRNAKYRGPVVIQASASPRQVKAFEGQGLPRRRFEYGALIGVADLVDVVPMGPDVDTSPWAWGPYCWKLSNARAFKEAIPIKGMLGLYSLPRDKAVLAAKAIESSFRPQLDEVANRWIAALTTGEEEDERELEILAQYFGRDDGENALRIAERRLSRERSADTLLDRANAYHLLGNAELALADANAALTDANSAIAKDGTNAGAYYSRSQVYDLLRDLDATKAAELDPEYAEEEEEEDDDE